MRLVSRLMVGAAVMGATVVAWEQPALAACHAFTVSAGPGTVAEGGTVTVTVTRDGGVNPSNVDVSTVDGTARAGSDFTAVRRTISFTTETQQSFTVPVPVDTEAEGTETFALHLSNPGGCPVNTSFVLGSDAPITIAASAGPTTVPPTTVAPPTSAPVAPPTTRTPTTTTTTAASQAPTTPTTLESGPTTTGPTPMTTAEPTTRTEPGDDTEGEALARPTAGRAGGGRSLGPPAALAALLAAGGLGYVAHRRRATQ